MRHIITFFFLFILCYPGFGQVDSISLKLAKNSIAFKTSDEIKDRILVVSDSLKKHSTITIRLAYLNKLAVFKEIKSDPDFNGYVLNFIGNIYNGIGSYHDAITTFERGINAFPSNYDVNKDKSAAKANLIMNLGNSFYFLGSFDKAMYYYKKSLSLVQQMNVRDKEGKNRLALLYNNLAIAYASKDNPLTAAFYFNRALEINTELKDTAKILNVKLNIATCYIENKDAVTALNILRNVEDYFVKNQDSTSLSFTYNLISQGYYVKKDLKNALHYSVLSLNFCDSASNIYELKEIYKSLFKVYEKTGDYKNALKYYRYMSALKDSINSSEVLNRVKQREIQLDYKNIRYADSLNTAHELEVKDANINQKRKQNISLFGVLFLVIIALSIVYNRFKVTKKQKVIIEQKEKVALHQNEIITSQKHLVEEKQKEIVDSINYAKRIQYALIAHKEFLDSHLKNYFVLFKPKDIVSGDFYWATKKGDSFYIAVCDSTGHGVPGAFMSLLSIGFLNEAINEKNIEEPGKIFDFVRKRLCESLSRDGQRDGFDGIILCITNNKISYAAANNTPILVREGLIVDLKKDKMPVGLGEKTDSFSTFEIDVNAGDSLYLYTDGFPDQFGGPKGKKFKYKALNDLLTVNTELNLNEQKAVLDRTFTDWKGDLEQVDDVCLFGIRF